jgi:type IV pilus assembly protein PilN
MRRINLLPPEERRGPAERLRGRVAGILLIVGAATLIIMVGVYLFFFLRLGGVRDDIARLDRHINEQNQRLAELAPYRDLKARLDTKKPVADGIFRTRFPWDEFLQGLAFIIPKTTALDSFTAKAAPINIQAPAEEPLEPPGSIKFTGIALPRYLNVADFVVQMNELRFLSNSQLDEAALDRTDLAPQQAIAFTVGSQLITMVGENGTKVPLDTGSLAEAANTAGRDQYQARVEHPGSEHQ